MTSMILATIPVSSTTECVSTYIHRVICFGKNSSRQIIVIHLAQNLDLLVPYLYFHIASLGCIFVEIYT